MTDRSRTAALDLPSDPATTLVVRAAFRALVECRSDIRFATREVDEIELVLQEAVTNAIRHAHGCDSRIRFRVDFEWTDEGLTIVVTDHGGPFQFPAEPPAPELLREGGYGAHIMRTWMDQVSVERLDGGNALRLRRAYRTDAVSGGEVALVARA